MSHKIEKVNSLLVQEISLILNKKFHNLDLMTVTAAECSKDLRSAKIWISILGEKKENKIKILKDNLWQIQQELYKRLDLKYCPKIHFRLDKSEDNYSKINKLLKRENEEIK